jgi:hypothetical protein
MRIILSSVLTGLLVIPLSLPCLAQTTVNDSKTAAVHCPCTETIKSQARLLIEINNALLHGTITGEQAATLRQSIDALVRSEELYLANGQAIPATVVRKEITNLDGVQTRLDRFVGWAQAPDLKGSAVLQDRVMSQLEKCVAHQRISPKQATDFRTKVNSIGAQEAWYLSTSANIPDKIILDHTRQLNDLSGQLKNASLTAVRTAAAL